MAKNSRDKISGIIDLIDRKPEDIKKLRDSLFHGDNLIPFVYSGSPKRIKEEINNKKKELENIAYEQDITLKRITLNRLFLFLAIETLLIFSFSFLQAVKWLGFHLEEWSFKLLVAATISQITIMLNMAVRHLFPTKK